MLQVYKISVNHKEFMSARSCLYMKEITEIKLNLVQLILKKAEVKCRKYSDQCKNYRWNVLKSS